MIGQLGSSVVASFTVYVFVPLFYLYAIGTDNGKLGKVMVVYTGRNAAGAHSIVITLEYTKSVPPVLIVNLNVN